MTDKEVAMEIVRSNEEIIKDRLLADGYMFDDELNKNYICSPVIRELDSCIEEYFRLDEEEYIIRVETNAEERSDGFFYYSECKIEYTEVRKMACKHYNNHNSF